MGEYVCLEKMTRGKFSTLSKIELGGDVLDS